ncbi:UDP-glucose 4-epimerase GalE [Verrucomicrobiales bacterium]|nr:UDP-glucose 4-epimerase GalE [Verrucomicrobiales bacterium]
MSNNSHDSEKKAVLVTGGAGYIGSHTVRALVAAGEKVVVLDNLVYGHREALEVSEGITFVEGDMGDRDFVETVFSENDIGAVLHFAAYCYVGESVEEPIKYYDNNTAKPLVLLDAMRRHEVKRFILSSTCATYGDPQYLPLDENHQQSPVNPYGWSKYMLERIIRDCGKAYGIQAVFLRYFNASGCASDGVIGEDHNPETHLIPLVLMAIKGERENITVFGTDWDTPDGTCVRDYIHVEDLASAHISALGYLRGGGETIGVNVGTGTGVSVKQIIELAEEVTGKTVPVVYGERRAGDPSELIAKPELVKEVLGWTAKHTEPRAMVESAWAWMSGPRSGRYPE